MLDQYPKVSILIPTLNAGLVLEKCLASIAMQDYPKKSIEIIVADGGSSDGTLEIAKKYGANVVPNPLKTAESGKMAALRASSGIYIALIDSDNILPDENWLNQMITPLENIKEAVGSEPLNYTWRAQDGFIARYSALIGMNDPLIHFLGNYDRYDLLTGKWTEIPHLERDLGEYLLITFDARGIPTIGANGTIFRRDFLMSVSTNDYLFDVDILSDALKMKGNIDFIKVKNGIIHTYCESSILKFALKQRRRVRDYLYHRSIGDRSYKWQLMPLINGTTLGYLKFILYCITIFPLIIESIYGYTIKPDMAWFFHPLACEITLWEYSIGVISGLFHKSQASRSDWKQ